MKNVGLYITIAIILGALLGIPLALGLYVGNIAAKMLLGFSVF